MRDEPALTVVGGGLAGSEAAWQAARAGVRVRLVEMRPRRETAAHRTDGLAELVCSNSFRSDAPTAAVGLLKEELRTLGSLVLDVADRTRVPAGGSLAVDREAFSRGVTEALEASPRIEIVREEATDLPAGPAIVATGPLTSSPLYDRLREEFGRDHLYFYDAISPIVTRDSIDFDVAFFASRWGKGGDDYVNCPMDEAAYERFVDEVLAAEKVEPRDFEKCIHFEGCMPIEELARRGRRTLAFGPMKPVGLVDPRTGRRPWAVVQLRQDDAEGRLFSMVGFQTKMKWPEQRRVFRLIPGLENAEFVRLGSLHRNTFLFSPAILLPTLRYRRREDLHFAGQMTGVEGYVESCASGWLAGTNAARRLLGRDEIVPPPTTALGSLVAYVTDERRSDLQPMNANYGLFPPVGDAGRKVRGKDRREAHARRGRAALREWMAASRIDATDGAARGAA